MSPRPTYEQKLAAAGIVPQGAEKAVEKKREREKSMAQPEQWETWQQAQQAEALYNAYLDAKKTDLELARTLREKLERLMETGENPVTHVEEWEAQRKAA